MLAELREGGPGIDLGDGDESAAETLLLLPLALLILFGPVAFFARRSRAARAATAIDPDARPLLFLDIDGVIALNPFSDGLPPGRIHESPSGLTYVPNRAGELVRKLATRFDVVWASGWEHHANSGLSRPLGLRQELPVLTFGRKARAGSSKWKIKPVDDYAGDRPVAWLDDNFVGRHERWAAHRSTPTLLVAVDSRSGLGRDHVDRLMRWADRLTQSRAADSDGKRQARAS